MRLRSIFLSAVAVLLAGCQTTPLDRATIYFDRAGFPSKLESDLGVPATSLQSYGRCSVKVTTPGSNRAHGQFCVYALQENALHILRWNAATMRYEENVRYEFAALQGVALARMLRTTQVQMIEPMRFSGFGAVIDDGGYYDNDASAVVLKAMLDFGVSRVESGGMITDPPAAYPIVMPIVLPR